jgi:hypothetical protein
MNDAAAGILSSQAVTGTALGLIAGAAVLTFPVAFLILWRYQRAVARAMGPSGTEAPPPSAANNPDLRAERPPLVVDTVAPPEVGARTGQTRLPGLAVQAVYVAAGLACALAMGICTLLIDPLARSTPLRVATVTMLDLWPLVIATPLILGLDRRCRMATYALYFALVQAVFFVVSLGSLSDRLTAGARAFIGIHGLMTVFVILVLNSRIRSIGPIVMALALMALTGVAAVVLGFGSSPAFVQAVAHTGSALGLGEGAIIPVSLALGFVVTLGIGVFMVRGLARLYARGVLSDQMITVGSIFLLFGVTEGLPFGFVHPALVLLGPAIFVLFVIVATLGFALIRRQRPSQDPPGLLVLRVFALGRASRRLFEMMGTRWRFRGPVRLIGGPDLATATVEPGQLLTFLAGQLQTSFVHDAAKLQARLEKLDRPSDPDGRYRVAELLCRDRIWRSALRALAARSQVVFMDLRSFSRQSAGCTFEIQALLDLVELDRILIAVDRTTDAAFLREVVQEAWGRVEASSPNVGATAPRVRLIELEGKSSSTLALLQQLEGVDDRPHQPADDLQPSGVEMVAPTRS